jgi:hypothetical protein
MLRSANIDIYVSSGVSGLLFCRCPSAIIWAVWAAHIRPTIQRMLWAWPQAHIEQKQAEIVPSLANLNPSTAIILVLLQSWIVASAPHQFPDFIFWSLPSQPMFNIRLSGGFLLRASTRGRVAAPKAVSDYDDIGSTGASANPICFFGFAREIAGYDSQSAKSLSRQINEVARRCRAAYLCISHLSLLNSDCLV